MSNKEFFKELVLNSDLSAEEIYETIRKSRKNDLCTKRIYRNIQSWRDSIYEGAIGEDDFLIAEAGSSSIADGNIAMRYNDYRDTMIRFIDEFRTEWKKHPDDNLMKGLVNFSCVFAQTSFDGAGRNSTRTKQQRKNFSKFDDSKQVRQYDISQIRGEGQDAVCCERNSTIGNIFQFAGFEVIQIAGELINEDENEGHFFTLVKHGPEKGYYSIIDAFNQIVKPKVLPGDYHLSNGFEINVFDKRRNRDITYKLEGPLLEMTDEILQIEADLRRANILAEKLTAKNYRASNHNEELTTLENMYTDLQLRINNGNYKVVLKDRYIKYIQFRLKQIHKTKLRLEDDER